MRAVESLDLPSAFGSLRAAIAGTAALSRCIWKLAFEGEAWRPEPLPSRSRYVHFSHSRLVDLLAEDSAFSGSAGTGRAEVIMQLLEARALVRLTDGTVRAVNTVCQPLRLCRDLLSCADYQLRYLLMLAVREHYCCAASSQIAHLFHFLADRLNELHNPGEMLEGSQNLPRTRQSYPGLYQELLDRLKSARIEQAFASEALDLFLECCRAVNYIQVDYKPNYVALMTKAFDAEFLLSRLFGLSTNIAGFDELFGGGLLLPDCLVPDPKAWSQGLILGRMVLVTGRYATGKSLLALQMAVEVAKKGGAAWFMPLEQTAEECLYVLETMGALPTDGSVQIARNTVELEQCLSAPPRAGLLILLRSVKDSYDDFLELLPEHGSMLKRYPLRMLAVDPVNAITRANRDPSDYRERTIVALEKLKRERTNIWMNVEESPGPGSEHLFEQNIADVVLRLSVSEEHGFTQTYMEVTKSRLQRQQRGRHPYVIQTGRGITISASSVSFADRIRARSVRIGEKPQTFGIADFNRIIGPGLVRSGDVIVLAGPGGTFKTYVGLMFLFATSRASTSKRASKTADEPVQLLRNLLIPARDNTATLEARFRDKLLVNRRNAFSRFGGVSICGLPSGHVQPGEILQRIEREFLDARLRHQTIERVMVDNVPHWELACPYVRDDETFADTLLNLLRGQGCTTLLTCDTVGQGSHLQKTIIDSADCVIDFSNIQFRGSSRVLVRVTKTRSMLHRRETFELVFSEGSIELSPDAELLRVSANNQITPVNVRLFLHSENDIQRRYNGDIRNSVESTLAPQVALDSQSRVDVINQPGLGAVSSVDELQILQLDEFQVRGLAGKHVGSVLHRFHNSDWDSSLWSDFDSRLLPGVKVKGSGFVAVPFCQNVGVLAYHVGRIPGGELRSNTWEEVAETCMNLEAHAVDTAGAIAFEFAQVTDENFNCLFFEILHSQHRFPVSRKSGEIEHWLRSAEAVEAARLMRKLCKRTYDKRREQALKRLRKRRSTPSQVLSIELDPTAAVWRTWFSTLMQMLVRLPPNEVDLIRIVALPQGVGVSGEWFLGVPSYSAAPDVALRLIRYLTSREAEFERLKRGVGLPTRPALYPHEGDVSEWFRLPVEELNQLFKNAFRRSDIPFYRGLSSVLASHLQAIIELPSDDPAEIQRLLETAVSQTLMVQQNSLFKDRELEELLNETPAAFPQSNE
jgi:KaiC/GvpD/RAD55 family RecA-like ATPase